MNLYTKIVLRETNNTKGGVAERQGWGLQNLIRRFESDHRLHLN